MYNRTFTWLVSRLNSLLEVKTFAGSVRVMGLLDIYGFEILLLNR